MFRNLVKGYLIRVARKIVSRLHKPKSCRCRVKKGTKLVNSSISKLKAQTVRQISSSFITPTVLLCRVAANTKSTKSYHHDQRRRAGGQLLPPREQPKWLYIHPLGDPTSSIPTSKARQKYIHMIALSGGVTFEQVHNRCTYGR